MIVYCVTPNVVVLAEVLSFWVCCLVLDGFLALWVLWLLDVGCGLRLLDTLCFTRC